jgi:hypothetical protein
MKTVLEIDNYNGKMQKPIGSGFNAKVNVERCDQRDSPQRKVGDSNWWSHGDRVGNNQSSRGIRHESDSWCKDVEKARTNLKGIDIVEVMALDLIDPRSIDTFAKQFLTSGRPLHLPH